MRALKVILITGALISLAVVSAIPALNALKWLKNSDNPVKLTELALQEVLTKERLDARLNRAIEKGDGYLAASYVALAEQEKIPLRDQTKSEFDSLYTWSWRRKQDVLDGADWLEDVLIGDVSDLYTEAEKYLQGKNIDHFIVGLATISLATKVSMIGPAARRMIVKAYKSGRLSPKLENYVRKRLADGVDMNEIASATRRIKLSEPQKFLFAVRNAINLHSLSELTVLGKSIVELEWGNGTLAGEALAVVHNPDELERVLTIEKNRGEAAAAIMNFLGRDAIVISRDLRVLCYFWIFIFCASILYLAGFLLSQFHAVGTYRSAVAKDRSL